MKFSRPKKLYLIKVSLLKIQLHSQINAYPTDPKRVPKRKGTTIPGKSRIINTVNTRPTQILYKRLPADFKIFKGS